MFIKIKRLNRKTILIFLFIFHENLLFWFRVSLSLIMLNIFYQVKKEIMNKCVVSSHFSNSIVLFTPKAHTVETVSNLLSHNSHTTHTNTLKTIHSNTHTTTFYRWHPRISIINRAYKQTNKHTYTIHHVLDSCKHCVSMFRT